LTRARRSEEDVELLPKAAAGVVTVPRCRSLRRTARAVPRCHPCPRRRRARPPRRSLTGRPRSRRRTPSLPPSARSSASQAEPHRPASEPEQDELEFAPGAVSGYRLAPPPPDAATAAGRGATARGLASGLHATPDLRLRWSGKEPKAASRRPEGGRRCNIPHVCLC
jgi:hypothetical protein